MPRAAQLVTAAAHKPSARCIFSAFLMSMGGLALAAAQNVSVFFPTRIPGSWGRGQAHSPKRRSAAAVDLEQVVDLHAAVWRCVEPDMTKQALRQIEPPIDEKRDSVFNRKVQSFNRVSGPSFRVQHGQLELEF